MDLMWFPMVVHSEPLMTPMFLTDSIVKNKSLSASAEERDQQGASRAPARAACSDVRAATAWVRALEKRGSGGEGAVAGGCGARVEEEREEKWQETRATDYRPSFCGSCWRERNRAEHKCLRTSELRIASTA